MYYHVTNEFQNESTLYSFPLLSLKPPIWRRLQARSSFTLRQTIKCRFTLKLVREMILNTVKCTVQTSSHSSIIWPVWLNGRVFVYELSRCGYESLKLQVWGLFRARTSLTFRKTILECRFGLKLVRHIIIHTVKCTVQINYHNATQSLASLAKWLSVRLQTKWLWVRLPLLSLKVQIWHLLRARTPLTFKQTIESRFTLKLVRDMIMHTVQKSYLS